MPDLAGELLAEGLSRMVRRDLRGVWLRGPLLPGPFVWAANHHSWWDPFLAAALLRRRRRAACLIMDQENLARYGFLRRLGVFGVREPRVGLRYLNQGRVLIIFPEGELRPAGPLGGLAAGAAWYAERAGVPLCPVAVRVANRGHQAPEAYVSIAGAEPGPLPDRTGWLARVLADELDRLDRDLSTADPRLPLPGFQLAVAGRRSFEERIDAWAGRWPVRWPWRS